MARFRKTLYLIVEGCVLVTLSVTAGVLVLHENVFRQLPLYCFLEEKAQERSVGQDRETYEKLMESNARYLGRMVVDENKEVGSKETDRETEDKQSEREEDVEKDERPEKPTITSIEKPEITVTPITQNTEEQKVKNADKQTEPEENLTEESTGEEEVTTAAAQVQPMPEIDLAPERLADYDYLMNHFFILDPNTETSAQQLNAAALLGEDLTLRKEKAEPQILIYHSHSQETFADSREGKTEDTIVGVGDYLAQLLTENYGYQVMHVTEAFDLAGGELDRSKAYDYARAWLEPVLEEKPSIQILIDLHRDGVPEDRHLVTEINGKPTAQIMFYNGLSHTINSGDLSYLPNPYIQDNLAFSFQLEYQAALYYPELYRGIYLAGLRYNLHLRPRALLLEAGAQTNTVQEVKNAMEPFADILNRVLQGEN
ncbi:MAG: stage II sporulation protein P [Blautia obeum]